MNTNMIGFRCFFKNLCVLVLWTRVASALEGLRVISGTTAASFMSDNSNRFTTDTFRSEIIEMMMMIMQSTSPFHDPTQQIYGFQMIMFPNAICSLAKTPRSSQPLVCGPIALYGCNLLSRGGTLVNLVRFSVNTGMFTCKSPLKLPDLWGNTDCEAESQPRWQRKSFALLSNSHQCDIAFRMMRHNLDSIEKYPAIRGKGCIQ